MRPAGPRKLLEECSGKFYRMSGSGDRRTSIPHLERFTANLQREEYKRPKYHVRGASGFSNRRFERRFCPLLPTGAKVGRAAARKTPIRLRQRKEPRARRRGIRCGRGVVSSQAAAAEPAFLHFTAAVGAAQVFHGIAPFCQVKHSVRSTEMMPPVQRMSPSMSSSTSNCRTMAAAPSSSSWVRS